MSATPSKKTVLIVEDEPDLVQILEYNLAREGFETARALTGEDALVAALGSRAPDLVLLDLMLPDMSGKEVCRQMRANDATRNVPVIMVTAKGEEIDRVIGFEVGADDYLVKPFSVRELMLRIHAVMRRTAPQQVIETVVDRLEVGPVALDVDAHRAYVGDAEVELTALEYRLLQTFVERRGRVQTRDRLLADVWGYTPDVTTRTVDTHVKRLRRKLGPDAGNWLETVRGVGYRFKTAGAAG